jgi:hypothetical protein
MAEVVVMRHAPAISNDCRESEAIVVVVNECADVVERWDI